MNTLFVGQKILKLAEIESTNNFASKLIADASVFEGTVVTASYQTAGKGQRGNIWQSEHGKNLTLSIILKPTFLPASAQFKLNKAVSLALADFVSEFTEEKVSIKWPNDIYVKDKKIAGILIENQLKNATIQNTIVGIGINVNQTEFESLSKATSLKIISAKDYDLESLLGVLCEKIESRYLQLKNNGNIDEQYLKILYRYNTESLFESEGEIFSGIIIGISPSGKLLLEKKSGGIREFDLKEVAFII
jgi:BirA family transcriptional regulator, biotin operon repressor / biotin---[acetyl-CoA-carboxylase] ligase